MATLLNQREAQITIPVSWDTYERLLAEPGRSSGVRFYYDQGSLEIIVPSVEHETIKRTIEMIIDSLIAERDIDFVGAGSTTFNRKDLEKGFEPDSSYYFHNADKVEGKKGIDLSKDPPPDLVIEVDVSSYSAHKLTTYYAAIGVPEVWRYSEGVVSIWNLVRNRYHQRDESPVLPKVTSAALTDLVRARGELKGRLWLRRVREWARTL